MQTAEIVHLAERFIKNGLTGGIKATDITPASMTGVLVYDAPLIACGDATDELFAALKQPNAIGPHHLSPREWLPDAQTVISVFLPFSAAIRNSNRMNMALPSAEWLYARNEGQQMINQLSATLRDTLTGAGYAAVAPSLDARFSTNWETDNVTAFTSNWSERHAAYICGLGTFGLSKGLITAKGVAGRFTSIVTNLSLPVTRRTYTGLYDHCGNCGACARNCPAGAISMETGKDHFKCVRYIKRMQERFAPRHGCGKCQVKVPCETRACPAPPLR